MFLRWHPFGSLLLLTSCTVHAFRQGAQQHRYNQQQRLLSQPAVAVTTSKTIPSSSRTALGALNLPNPFKRFSEDESEDSLAVDEFEETAAGLIRQARRLLSSDFGILDSTLLSDEDFIWVGPFLDQPLTKTEYLAAGRFFDIRAAFPDLDYRAHDFRIDTDQDRTVRLSCRVTGTMRGALRLRSGNLPPTGKSMKCPPEAVTISFDRKGQVTKLCTGFCIDRQVGNTRGATGVMAAAMVAGQPPSDWDLYPAPAVIARFFGRPVPALNEVKAVLAPFPETVMIQLAKGILATNMASEDPTLLADQFEYSTPYEGPIRKQPYLEKYAAQEFENLDPDFTHFRVDPFDPFRVWVDVLPSGPGYYGAPQAMSFTFDDDGFCTRVTSSYVMDPSIGNGGGLGGREGYLYATDRASLPVLTRPWSRVVGRFRKKLLQPLTGVDVDDYVPVTKKKSAPRPTSKPSNDLPSSPAETLSSLLPNDPTSQSAQKPKPSNASPVDPEREARRKQLQAEKEAAIRDKAELAQKRAAAAEQKKQDDELKKQAASQAKLQQIEDKRKAAEQKLKDAEEKRKAQAAAAAEKKAQAEARRKEMADAKKEEALRKKKEREEENKKTAEARKAKAQPVAKKSKPAPPKPAPPKSSPPPKKVIKDDKDELAEKAEAAKKAAIQAAAERRERQKAALEAISNAVSRATVSLFGLARGSTSSDDDLPPAKPGKSTMKAPIGVPGVSRWRQNSDGSITGIVRGSRNFADGDKITTSPIATGKIEPGQVVKTGSGSKYFLE